jgi:hypothetical protein
MRVKHLWWIFLSVSSSLVGCAAPTSGTGDDSLAPASSTSPPEGEDAGSPGDSPPESEDAAPAPPAYPDGPYAKTKGKTYPDVPLAGYHEGKGEWTSISMSDYFDSDGSKGVNAIYVLIVAQWCSVCMQEAAQLPALYDERWKGRGAKFVMAMAQDRSGKSPTKATVDQWKAAYPQIDFELVLDAKASTLPPSYTGFPTALLIDPRTMRVLDVFNGVTSDGSIPGLEALLTRNGG